MVKCVVKCVVMCVVSLSYSLSLYHLAYKVRHLEEDEAVDFYVVA